MLCAAVLCAVLAKTKYHGTKATVNGHAGLGVLLGFEGPNCVVQRVLPGSELELSGSANPGDRITSIGGIKLRKKKLAVLQKQLAKLPRDVPLGLSRQVQTVELTRSSNATAFGFELNRRYGIASAPPTVSIGKILPGSVAEHNAALHSGAELLSVNGEAVAGMNMRAVAAQVQLAFPTAKLEVRNVRNQSESEPLFSRLPQVAKVLSDS
jgi:C-terminal processing protease CtpA/Prc